jgi:hypothetical protein
MQRRVAALLALLGALLALAVLLVLAGLPGSPASSQVARSTGTASPMSRPTGPALPSTSPMLPTLAPTAAASLSTPAPPPIPAFEHVFLLVLENKEAGSIIGNAKAPYINSLADRYGLAANYLAVAHPSQPNYFALWSGSTRGAYDDAVHDFRTGRTLADQLEAHGRSWHVAAQNVPLGCYTGATASGGADGQGTYARKHEPAISWTGVSGDPGRCARITDFSHFDPTVGDFWLIVPNLCNDMHDCSISTGDAFLEGFLPTILDSPAFGRGVVFLTFDEGTSDLGGGGKVATIVISPLARRGYVSDIRHSHYSLLRTIERAWGLGCLANACQANDLRELFR